MHAEPYEKYNKDDKDEKYTGKDYKSDSHNNGDDNKDPKKIREQPQPLVDIHYRDYIKLEHDAEKGG